MDRQYWPEDVGSVLVAGNYRVHSEEVENCDDDFIVTHLKLEQVGPSILENSSHLWMFKL
jgi:hypothetical protein